MVEEAVKKKRRSECSAPSEPQPAKAAVGVQQSEEEKLKQEQEKEFIVNADHGFLVEKIERLRRQINSPLTLKLRDKGEKIRRSLTICEQELQRRNQFAPTITKEAEDDNSKQSKGSSSPVVQLNNNAEEIMPCHSPNEKSTLPVPADKGVSSDMRSDAPSSQAHSQPEPTAWLFQMLGKKKGLPFSRGNTKRKGLLFNNDRREFNLSMRQPPFRPRFSGYNRNFPNRLSRRETSGPSAAKLAEVLSSIHAMQQQLENMRSQMASFESNVTTRIDRLETKVEQIILGQNGDKSSHSST